RHKDASPRGEQPSARSETVLEADAWPEPLQERVALAVVRHRVRACEDAELHNLRAEDRRRNECEHSVDLPRATEDIDRPTRQQEHPRKPEQEQDDSRQEI